MPRWFVSILVIAAVAAGVLGWGYWYSLNHAYLNISVNDHGLRTDRRRYASPHGVSLVLRDAAQAQLAVAHSIEPVGYILAVHPSADIGDCRLYERSPSEHSSCYERYSQWSADWAPRVQFADVAVGDCRLRLVPVTARRSNEEWLVWWVPLPHVGGLPRQHHWFSIDIDSKACTAVTATPRGDVPAAPAGAPRTAASPIAAPPA